MITDARVGTTVGDYTIEALLGRGGMGVVYRARHDIDGRVVALKLMLPELSANEDFRERFIREAEFGPALDHPNIVPVYETGEVAGELFIAMHLVEGSDLKTLIKRDGPLAPRRVLSILAQAARGLDAAHEMLVVHRDVKPQNIMISPGDEPDERDLVFLTDFGLIRPVASESTASRTGQIFGSIQYMAPEQIEGLPADGRADIYSLACVAYECLTGRIPFDRPNEIGAIWAHIHEDPPRASDARPELARGIDDVIRQAMAKHPDDRYLTCGEFVSALKAGLKKQRRQLVPTPLRPLVKRATRPKTEREIWAPNFFPELSRVRKLTNRTDWRGVVASTTVLVLLATGLVEFAHEGGVAGMASDVGRSVADAADAGRRLVSSLGGDPVSDREDVDDGRGRSAAGSPRSSEDSLAPLRENVLHRRPPRGSGRDPGGSRERVGGPVLNVPTSLAKTKIVFSAYRGCTAFASCGEIFIMNADGTEMRKLTTNDPAGQEFSPALSPDARSVAFVSSRGGAYDIYVMDLLDNTTARVTVTPEICEFGLSWSADGSKILFGDDCGLYSEPYGTGTQQDSDLWVVNADGSGRSNLTGTPTAYESGGDWSPDGRQIVFDRDGDLYLANADGGDVRLLWSGAGHASFPKWCDSGSVVFEASDEDQNADIFVVSVTGDRGLGSVERVTSDRARQVLPSCSPDGTKIAYQGESRLFAKDYKIHIIDRDGSNDNVVPTCSSGCWEYEPRWHRGRTG